MEIILQLLLLIVGFVMLMKGADWFVDGASKIADKYVEDLRNALRQKKKYPKTGSPLTYMGEFTGLYYVTFKEYIAFYRIHGDVIEVARVLFSRSDYMKVLFGKSEYILEDDED